MIRRKKKKILRSVKSMKSQALLMKITSCSKTVCISQVNSSFKSPVEKGFLVRMYFRSLREGFITVFFFFLTFIPQTFCISQFEACIPQFYVGVLQTVRLLFHNQECLIDIFDCALNCINKKVGINATTKE